ncbi:glycosyltransferase [Rhodococcus sp. NPDC059968]|uniref:glycosyltransferase n=1 Tax=Rhodococcus sp. NPDC059968 TaxID=3347017 RepID=UPI00366EFCB7
MTNTQAHPATTDTGAPTHDEDRLLGYPMVDRLPAGLEGLPTIVAVGPFDDLAHAEQLATAFTVVRRAAAHRVVTGVHLVEDSSGRQWPDVLAAADLVVPSTTTLREVLIAGRGVVAPEQPATVGLVVPTSAGLVYRRGDVFGMAEAMLQLLTTSALRDRVAAHARDVAPRSRAVERNKTSTNEQAVSRFRIPGGSREPI